MQSDIVIKKPPVAADINSRPVEAPIARQPIKQPTTAEFTEPKQPVEIPEQQPAEAQLPEEPVREEAQAAEQVLHHGPEAPVGVITAALFVCLFLVFMAVYGSLS